MKKFYLILFLMFSSSVFAQGGKVIILDNSSNGKMTVRYKVCYRDIEHGNDACGKIETLNLSQEEHDNTPRFKEISIPLDDHETENWVSIVDVTQLNSDGSTATTKHTKICEAYPRNIPDSPIDMLELTLVNHTDAIVCKSGYF